MTIENKKTFREMMNSKSCQKFIRADKLVGYPQSIPFPSNPYTEDKTYAINPVLLAGVFNDIIATCLGRIYDNDSNGKTVSQEMDQLFDDCIRWVQKEGLISIAASGFQPATVSHNNSSEFYILLNKGAKDNKAIKISFGCFEFFLIKIIRTAKSKNIDIAPIPFKWESNIKAIPGRGYSILSIENNVMDAGIKETYLKTIRDYMKKFNPPVYHIGESETDIDMDIPVAMDIQAYSVDKRTSIPIYTWNPDNVYTFVKYLSVCKLLGYMEELDWDEIYGASRMLHDMMSARIRMLYMKVDISRSVVITTVHMAGAADVVLESGFEHKENTEYNITWYNDHNNHVVHECKKVLKAEGLV